MVIWNSLIKLDLSVQSGGVIGQNPVKIDDLRVVHHPLRVEIHEKSIHSESTICQQREEFRMLQPADGLPGMVG